MKVFMSWSGDRSREVAKLLHVWIKCVVQASQPWISTSGIDSGSIWFNQINSELQDTTFGIICLTSENKESPWILFEAGALAKGLASNRVCTFLIDLGTSDIRDPLAQFNHTLPNSESVWKLVSTLNGSLPDVSRLDVIILRAVFDTYWPQFEEKFSRILKDIAETTIVPPREEKDMLAEILESTRNLTQRMRSIEIQQKVYHVPTSDPWANGELAKMATWGREPNEEALMSNGEAMAIIDALRVSFPTDDMLLDALVDRYGNARAIFMMDAHNNYQKNIKRVRRPASKQ